MKEKLSERRMAENEAIFRKLNERVQQRFDSLEQIAKEDNQESLVSREDAPLHFYCECSDENCRKRVVLSPSLYDEIHQDRRQFVVLCGHEVGTIERVVHEEPDFCIIEKFITPPESVGELNSTDVDNS